MPAKRNIADLLKPDDDENNHSQPPTKIPRFHSPPSPEPHKFPYISVSPTPTPPFQQPLPLLTFSYTPSHILEFTDSALRYFVNPPQGADLNYGVERWIKRPEERGRVDGLLKAWSKVRGKGKEGAGLGEVGVIAWRGVITKYVSCVLFPH
jgi:RAT1-interacting protein